MKRPSKAAVGVAAVIGVLAAVAFVITPKAVEVCVTVYEDVSSGGDHTAFCAVGATNVHIPNLTSYTSGLNNGCNRGINQSSTWNDCISSANVTSLPANTKLIWYQGASYSSTQTCFSADGSYNMNLSGTNDTISSFRIIAGSC